MRSLWMVIVLVVLVRFSAKADFVFAEVDQIEQDYALGKISKVEEITLLGYRLFDPQRLPQQYFLESQTPLKCGTEIIAQLRSSLPELNAEDRAYFQKVLQRPDLPDSYVSPEGLFKLHYTKLGTNRVPTLDSNSDGVPDYVEQAGLIFDYCYHFEIDSLGYQQPPSDFGVAGNEIDVYFRNLSNAYGYTDFDQEIPTTSYNDWTSYVTLDNDFAEAHFYKKDLDAVRVTAAHELFHVIQLGYNFRDMDVYFFEMSSTWMEDRVYDEVNDYYQYLASYLFHMDLPLTYINGAHEYGASLFLKCIVDNYSDSAVRRTWENIRQVHSMNALNQALTEQGSDLATAFTTFAIWNYFTGQRSNLKKYYTDAEKYPLITENQVFTFRSDTTVIDSSYFLTATYYKMTPEISSYFSVQQNHEQPEDFRSGMIVEQPGNLFITSIPPGSFGTLGFVNGYNDIILIAVNVEIPIRLDESLYQYDQRVYRYRIFPGLIGGTAPIFPNPYVRGQHQYLSLKLILSQPTLLSCSILTENGRSVRQFPSEKVPAGETTVQFLWNGTDSSGNIVASGTYLCIVNGAGVKFAQKFVVVNP